MSHQLHFASKYQVKYDGDCFNYQVEQFDRMVTREELSVWGRDMEEYELEPEAVADYIKRLLLEPDAQNQYMWNEDAGEYIDAKYTNNDVAECLQQMLDGYDKNGNDYIRVSWF